MLDQPYFMTNEEWYYFDYKENKHKITDKAPEKAKKSYNEYYKQLKKQVMDVNVEKTV